MTKAEKAKKYTKQNKNRKKITKQIKHPKNFKKHVSRKRIPQTYKLAKIITSRKYCNIVLGVGLTTFITARCKLGSHLDDAMLFH